MGKEHGVIKECRNIRIVHFVIDDKFIDPMIFSFDSLGNWENQYILIRNMSFQKIRSIKSKHVLLRSRWQVKKDIQNENFADFIILHSLYSLPMDLVPIINKRIKVVWFSWGYDLYENTPPIEPIIKISNMFGNITSEYVNKSKTIRVSLKKRIRKAISLYLWPVSNFYLRKTLLRINYFSGVIPEEYELLKLNVPYFDANKVGFSYPLSIKDMYSEDKINSDDFILGNNILLGNSSTETNNHLDVLFLLQNEGIIDRKLILPLSYGSDLYRQYVVAEGRKLFKENFIPIMTFMPFEEYNSIIKSCSIAIFAHERQQALGNILMCLWNGCKVFLSKNSIVYKYLKSLGTVIYSIQDDLTRDFVASKMYESDIYKNRGIITVNYSSKSINSKIEAILHL